MKISKSQIDKAGRKLSAGYDDLTEELVELEVAFDDYRKAHLQPLTETTIEVQNWLRDYSERYYVAQRLKRKPQILRKLNRFSVRLSQLQDIGGLRIIVDSNRGVDQLVHYLSNQLSKTNSIQIVRNSDYREKGRDVTGYRAFHIIVNRGGYSIEIQIRSKIQHHWAESIERASVIYGYHLKEQEGDATVISYFKQLSDLFYEIEAGRKPDTSRKLEVEKARISAEELIRQSDKNRAFDSYVNDDIVKTMMEREKQNPADLNNWIIVFNWDIGSFVTWDVVGRDPDDAVKSYVRYEHDFPDAESYEVVLIGSSDVATLKQTHSHYFGIESSDGVLEGLEQAIIGLAGKLELDVGARQILRVMSSKKYWGKKTLSVSTLKNHFCSSVITFDASMESLRKKGFISADGPQAVVSLNIKKKNDIIRHI